MICELVGLVVVAIGLEYGTNVKQQSGSKNDALVAASIMLLFNLSDVFKSILACLLKLEILFRKGFLPLL
jgi:hypothetical protein